MTNHCFISYSTADAPEFARRLADELEGGEDKFVDAWLDKRDIDPGRDWDDQIVEAIQTCKCMLFVMTPDSVASASVCKKEWNWALKCKKVVVPIRLQPEVEQPFGLGNRHWIDFTGEFEAGVARLRLLLRKMDSPEGQLQALKDRLADAQRDLHRARKEEDKPRIQAEIEELTDQIKRQEEIVRNPEAAIEQTQKNIETGLERERKPEKPVAAKTETKFINPPPGIAPNYFQDRQLETHEIVKFLKNDAQTLMTIVGRGGVGKTAMVCRLLKGLESGELPDGLGAMKVDGIVYLSESGSHRANFANIFYDLCKLLPAGTAHELDAVYKNPQGSTESKMRAVLEKFTGGRVVLLLDNFEPLVDASCETCDLKDAELDEALRAFLNGTHTAVNIVITTRVAPRALNLIQPGRQRVLTLDEGLESPYAENILREMDSDGRMGLKSAPADLLARARERTRGYPRALEALFAILASDRYTTLEELLAMPTPENVVEALVGEAFNRLDTNAQKVMQALAVYNRPVTPAAVDYLLAPHIPAIDSAPILQRLANMHFARKESGRFYLHPVDREFAFGLIGDGRLGDGRLGDGILGNRESGMSAPNAQSTNFPNTNLPFTQHNLLTRAADYFAAARKPRAEWKKLDDLSAQLAEFDLRCAAGNYDTAASVLTEIDFGYLLLWGHYRLMIELHERLTGKITDNWLKTNNIANLGAAYLSIGEEKKSIKYFEQALELDHENKNRQGEMADLGNLGSAYANLGDVRKAIEFYERSLVISHEIGDRKSEGIVLCNIGAAYYNLGEIYKAIQYYEQALVIDREIGNRMGEGNDLGNLGETHYSVGNAHKAIEFYEQALVIKREIGDRRVESILLEYTGQTYLSLSEYEKAEQKFEYALQIADNISFPMEQLNARKGLSEAYLLQNDLPNARATIEAALNYDVPENNHNVSALHGIIALRQGDEVAAREAFLRAIGQADEILSKTAEFYSALDAKGLALCGLALCRDDLYGHPLHNTGIGASGIGASGIGASGIGASGIGASPIPTDATEIFRAARKIAPHAGVVKSVLRLFDELAKCDEKNILKDIRAAIEVNVER